MRKITLFFSLLLLLSSFENGFSQSAMDLLSEGEEKTKDFTSATFKGTRLINFHTIETPGKNTLEYRISHRFGTTNSGLSNFYGMDGGASIRMGLDYSYDGRLEVGLGRTNIDKTIDAYLKYRLLRQTTDGSNPLSITLVSSMFVTTQKDPNAAINGFDKYEYFTSRMSYAHQIMFARKFNDRFSLQIAPVFIHLNLVEKASDSNDIYAATALGRVKITKRIAVTGEFGMVLNKYTSGTYYNTAGIGVDIETGGHVFQIHVTNSQGMIESQYLPFTNTSWKDGGIRIGFNISRVFSL